MSWWKVSRFYWQMGPFDVHVFSYTLDPKARLFYELGIGRKTWQLWPPRFLNWRNEWTREKSE